MRERTRCVIRSPDARGPLFLGERGRGEGTHEARHSLTRRAHLTNEARRPLTEGEARCGSSLRVQLNDVAIGEYMFRPDMLAVEARVAPHARVAQ